MQQIGKNRKGDFQIYLSSYANHPSLDFSLYAKYIVQMENWEKSHKGVALNKKEGFSSRTLECVPKKL